MERRSFLTIAGIGTACLLSPSLARARCGAGAAAMMSGGTEHGLASGIGAVGELLPPDHNRIRLPAGFSSRIVAESGKRPVRSSSYVWHAAPDGGATFAHPDGGWVYVSNCEMPLRFGGASALRFDPSGELLDAYPILGRTSGNCAGGATPWGTWFSCEEIRRGRVWECDPLGSRPPVALPALGRFQHEAAVVDPLTGTVYMSEDEPDGRLYRFRPSTPRRLERPDLSNGALEVASLRPDGSGRVEWHAVPDPQARRQPTRWQVAESTRFDGGEGMSYCNGVVYLATKGDNRVWALALAENRMQVIYDQATAARPILRGVDNLETNSSGDVLVAEDGDDMQIVVLPREGNPVPLLQVMGQGASELTGLAFSPDMARLYFSSQRGFSGRVTGGITYEVTGPFAG